MTLMIDLNVQSAKLLNYNKFTAEKEVRRGNAEIDFSAKTQRSQRRCGEKIFLIRNKKQKKRNKELC